MRIRTQGTIIATSTLLGITVVETEGAVETDESDATTQEQKTFVISLSPSQFFA